MSVLEYNDPVDPLWQSRALWNCGAAIGLLLVGLVNAELSKSYPALVGWLPAGVGLGIVLLRGLWLLPGIFLGTLLIGLIALPSPGHGLILALEATLADLAIWYLLNRQRLFDLAQRRISDVGLMLLVATVVATLAATLAGPHGFFTPDTTHHAAPAHAPSDAHASHGAQMHADSSHNDPSLFSWLLADAIGILLVVPLALRSYRWSLAAEALLSLKNLAAFLLLLLLTGVTLAIYSGFLEDSYGIRHTTLLILPPAVWLALKYDLGYTLAGNFVIFLITGIGTSLGHGPFNDHTAGLPLLTMTTLFTTLLIAAGRTERKVAEETIQRLANEDQLTGLPNRNALNQRLEQMLAGARRYGRRVAVMFIDLDQFKEVNDRYGHDVGDRLLVEAVRRLNSSLRGDSILARFGGDEFIAVIDHVDDPVALTTVGQRMIDALSEPMIIDGHACQVSCSGGIAVFPEDGENTVDLLKNADIAMYHIKLRGKNGFQRFAEINHERAAAK